MEEKQRGLRFGSVEFSGYGAFPERFATELISRGVELRRVRFGEGTISGSVSPAHCVSVKKNTGGKTSQHRGTAAGRGCTWGSWRS